MNVGKRRYGLPEKRACAGDDESYPTYIPRKSGWCEGIPARRWKGSVLLIAR
jgi:hypothetical protein